MEEYLKNIKKKLEQKIKFEELDIIDNSYKHKKHKFFSKEKYHLHLKFRSLYLKSISRLNAQKLVMNVLKKDLEKNIHALEISID